MRFVLLLVAAAISGCAAINHEVIERSASVRPGMTEGEVISLLGEPGLREFSGSKSALQYCQTEVWGSRHKYAVIWINDDRVYGLTSYTQAATGSCQSKFMPVNWGNAPDSTIEIRNR